MTRLRHTRRSQGFTLIEVLVAMMIMAILAMMAWQGVDSIVQARNISQAKLEQLLRVNTVLAQFEQDIDSSQDSGSLPQSLPSFDGLSMRMTRRSPEGLRLVVWSIHEGTLMRWAGPAVTTGTALQESWVSSQQFLGNEPGQLKALKGITEWQCYFFRGNAWSNCQSSTGGGKDGQPSSTPDAGAVVEPASNDPIKGVRIVLSFGEGSGFNGTITREIGLGP